jgi:hypothetical protein
MKAIDGYKNYIFGAALFANGLVRSFLPDWPVQTGMTPEQEITMGIAWALGRNALKKVGA